MRAVRCPTSCSDWVIDGRGINDSHQGDPPTGEMSHDSHAPIRPYASSRHVMRLARSVGIVLNPL